VNLLLLGPQGSGKGTQAKRIAQAYGLAHVASGDMFRAAVAAGTSLGRRVESILASGALVPDDVTIDVVRDRLEQGDASDGFVLDGFPRTMAQARALDELLADLGRELTAVLALHVSDAVSVERLLNRAREEGRVDDTPEAIARRLAIYHDQTEPLIEYYRAQDRLVPIDGEGTVNEVFAQIEAALDHVAKRSAAKRPVRVSGPVEGVRGNREVPPRTTLRP
jgi:adenylate kinase